MEGQRLRIRIHFFSRNCKNPKAQDCGVGPLSHFSNSKIARGDRRSRTICSRAGRCEETVTSRGLTTVSGEFARSRAQADDLRRKATKRFAHQPRIVWVARCDHPRVSTQPRRVFHSEDTAQRIPRADQRQLAGQKCRANSWRHWGGIVVPRPISTQKC